ncbi:uncharacterized protein PV09_08525 [Verruconis gallopava]|uniref:Pkr1-domain-containing protein n=1 Tax=Verruconis gallopava TaxID=253628 RepID=A0A0D1ZZJ7_9PEZI|nr:uncharacterized protein PV09_08525 [Verruconis gallopava]KIV99857.1 hypothetical protein PV09_08525 [Verruconis gallopava]
MSQFITSLWESIFTPGPTPTLLIAANATFASLQILLLILFLATYSAHFIALSTICAGVWWGINWFAAELAKAQRAEEEAARIRKERRAKSPSGALDGATSGGEGDGEDEETETEVEGVPAGSSSSLRLRGGPNKIKNVLKSAGYNVEGNIDEAQGSQSKSLEPPAGLQKRRAGQGSSTDLSVSGTDSEWEKISETDK